MGLSMWDIIDRWIELLPYYTVCDVYVGGLWGGPENNVYHLKVISANSNNLKERNGAYITESEW